MQSVPPTSSATQGVPLLRGRLDRYKCREGWPDEVWVLGCLRADQPLVSPGGLVQHSMAHFALWGTPVAWGRLAIR